MAKSTVERLMRQNGWQGVRRQKKIHTTIPDPAAVAGWAICSTSRLQPTATLKRAVSATNYRPAHAPDESGAPFRKKPSPKTRLVSCFTRDKSNLSCENTFPPHLRSWDETRRSRHKLPTSGRVRARPFEQCIAAGTVRGSAEPRSGSGSQPRVAGWPEDRREPAGWRPANSGPGSGSDPSVGP